jgi:hypothetical protein
MVSSIRCGVRIQLYRQEIQKLQERIKGINTQNEPNELWRTYWEAKFYNTRMDGIFQICEHIQ